MITSPEDYINLLTEILNSKSYYLTSDTTFLANKSYYKMVTKEYENTDDTIRYYEDYELITDATVGETIAAWGERQTGTANRNVYECLGIEEGYYIRNQIALLLPSDENLYEVDLNARTVSVPQFLSVSQEHRAETLYFKVARYFENIDLSQMCCVILYINADGEGGIYAVPLVDVETYKGSNEMLIPWSIGSQVTKTAGTISFSIRFYQVNSNTKTFDYNLTTLPAECSVLQGFEATTSDNQASSITASELEELIDRVERAEAGLVLYWKNV